MLAITPLVAPVPNYALSYLANLRAALLSLRYPATPIGPFRVVRLLSRIMCRLKWDTSQTGLNWGHEEADWGKGTARGG